MVTVYVSWFAPAIGLLFKSQEKLGLPVNPPTVSTPLPQNVTGPDGLIEGGGGAAVGRGPVPAFTKKETIRHKTIQQDRRVSIRVFIKTRLSSDNMVYRG